VIFSKVLNNSRKEKMKNKCQNIKCNKELSYYPNLSYLIAKGKVLKVCNECNLIEIPLRLKKLYRVPNRKIMKHIEELIGIIDTQSKTISNLIIDKCRGDNNG
jgi:hypothetical protein